MNACGVTDIEAALSYFTRDIEAALSYFTRDIEAALSYFTHACMLVA